MEFNNPESDFERALNYLCKVRHGDRFAWFTVGSLSADLRFSEQEGRSAYSSIVAKGLARYIGDGQDAIIPTEAGMRKAGYTSKR